MVQDWSHHHVVFSPPTNVEQAMRLRQEPRFWQQHFRRNVQLTLPASEAVNDDSVSDDSLRDGEVLTGREDESSNAWFGWWWRRHRRPPPPNTLKRDWSTSLGPNATVGAGNYPAKFSFDINSANCGGAAQPDFVVFNTSVNGSSSQASIVAYDNLYTGCGGTVPKTYWAYNTVGAVVTSVVLSLDGSQIAFVQTSATLPIASLVLLKWKASTSGTTSSTNPDGINIVTPSQYATCTTPCMTTLAFSGLANDTNSSPFYDYNNDALYVGDNNGSLHKFQPVFRTGVPAEVVSGWPVLLASGLKLSSPVYDSGTGRVFVGSGFNGTTGSQLFAVTAATGAVPGTSGSLGKGVGIDTGPLVDSSTGEVFAFVGNDGGAGCSGPCMAVYQFAASFTSGTGIKATVGFGGSLPLYNGTFDNAYFTSANGTGNLLVCGGGFIQPEPTIFKIPINSGTMSTSSAFGPEIGLSNVACSPVSEVFNPAAGGVDRIFASVTTGSDAAACSSGGCIGSLIITTWQPTVSYALGQYVLDPANFLQIVTTAGTSKSGSPPVWGDTCGLQTTDGTVTWTNSGFLSPVTPSGWTPITFNSVGARILDSNNNYECALQTGRATGAFPPVWNTTAGGITTEITTLQWRNGGPMPNHALPAAGGTSGIIMDNIVGSGVLAGGSQVYFSTLGTGGSCGAGNGCAVQASQSGLN
jgi:hypothetical protein